MEHWTFYVDESGLFQSAAESSRSVGGLLCPDSCGFQLQAEVEAATAEHLPYWGWPIHATELKRPAAHLVRWIAEGRPPVGRYTKEWNALASIALSDPELGPRITTTVDALRSHTETVRVEVPWDTHSRVYSHLTSLHREHAARVWRDIASRVRRLQEAIARAVRQRDAEFIICGGAIIDSQSSGYPNTMTAYEIMLAEAIRRAILQLETRCSSGATLRMVVLAGHLGRGSEAEQEGAFSQMMQRFWPDYRPLNFHLSTHVVSRRPHFPQFDRRCSAESVISDWINHHIHTHFSPTTGHTSLADVLSDAGQTRKLSGTGITSAGLAAAHLRSVPDLPTVLPTSLPDASALRNLPRWAAEQAQLIKDTLAQRAS